MITSKLLVKETGLKFKIKKIRFIILELMTSLKIQKNVNFNKIEII